MALSPKQAAFVREYLIDLNATQAATRAGYSEKTAKAQGCRLLTNVYVKAAVQKGQQKAAEKAEISAEWVRNRLVDVHDLAIKDGELAPANKALELIGRHLGMFKDKVEVSMNSLADELELARKQVGK